MWYHQVLRGHLGDAVKQAKLPVNAVVLDAGCGTGGLLGQWGTQRPDWRCRGIDEAGSACEWARRKAPLAEITRGSVGALPYAAETFDLVVSVDVLYHLDDDLVAVKEMHRVLKPGGWLLVNVPAHPWLWSYHDVAVGGRRRYTRTGLRVLLAQGGFAKAEITHWNLLPLPWLVARRKVFARRSRRGSDVGVLPRPLECFFRVLSEIERGWLRNGRSLPAGSSLFARARRD